MEPDTTSSQTPHKSKVVQPLPGQGQPDPAVELIRQKINSLYKDEPTAKQEMIQVEAEVKPRSKHQQFMHDLSHSGKSLAEIQTAWHNYYVNLPDDEKHEVWQEFYAQARAQEEPKKTPEKPVEHEHEPKTHQKAKPARLPKPRLSDRRTVADIKKQLTGKIQKRGGLSAKSHFKSLLFGLGMGVLAIIILLFGFFNERFIAPFITPSRTVSSTPIIADPNGAAGNEPRVIIPKINVDVPVVYDEPSIQEDAVQKALERGVLHYATTPYPGQQGNGVIFGHSSNNILNPGKYKFAFVLLNRLRTGDTFMLEYEGKRYVYRVYDRKIVAPTELGVLGQTDRPATFSLITCDPPGTTRNRLVVIGEQISPDPTQNVASNINPDVAQQEPTQLPSNAPSLWERIVGWFGS